MKTTCTTKAITMVTHNHHHLVKFQNYIRELITASCEELPPYNSILKDFYVGVLFTFVAIMVGAITGSFVQMLEINQQVLLKH